MTGALAFATAIGFPDRLNHLLDMIDKNEPHGALFDADLLYVGLESVTWSAPTWCTPGDVCFFYCTTNWPMRLRNLRARTIGRESWHLGRMLATDKDRETLWSILKKAEELFADIGGRIFAFGEVLDRAELHPVARKRDRIRGRLYAKVGNVCVLDPPLDRELLLDHVAPRPRATVTHVAAKSARVLAQEIGRRHELPEWLATKRFGRIDPSLITEENWRDYVCREDFRVVNEGELREAFADNLVRVLASSDVYFEECECIDNGLRCGIADYMVIEREQRFLIGHSISKPGSPTLVWD